MPSFDAINYGLRPNKAIQRELVFRGLRQISSVISTQRHWYVGLGSIWFLDFVKAHRVLGIKNMVSIEAHDVGFARASFNKPFKSIRVRHGLSYQVIPDLMNEQIGERPWICWLDYDQGVDEEKLGDIRTITERAAPNSVLIVTMSAAGGPLGRKPASRPESLRRLFGNLVPDDLSADQCKGSEFSATLATLLGDFMLSAAAGVQRRFLQCISMRYTDGTNMITVGGVLPAAEDLRALESTIHHRDWPCRVATLIEAPHLTLREQAALQKELPRTVPLTRARVKQCGFDLEQEQIAAFERYYRQYPSFTQIELLS